jgi:hypothetical protein
MSLLPKSLKSALCLALFVGGVLVLVLLLLRPTASLSEEAALMPGTVPRPSPDPEPGPTPAEPVPATTSYDLHDPDLLERLGSPSPTDVDWQRTFEGVTVLGVGTEPDPAELDLMKAAISEVPGPLRAVASPRSVVRTTALASSDPTHTDARALTLGPDVYLTDETFRGGDRPMTRFDLARVYFHELAHVAQFRALDPDYIEALLTGELDRVDPTSGSELVRDFGQATGWRDTSDDPLRAA